MVPMVWASGEKKKILSDLLWYCTLHTIFFCFCFCFCFLLFSYKCKKRDSV